MVPAVQITLTGDFVHRSVVSDNSGLFVFDDLDSGRRYSVRADMAGFKEETREGVAVRPGETVDVDFSLRVCLGLGIALVAEPPVFDQMLMAAAIVHLRFAEDGRDRLVVRDDYCGVVNEAPATILEVGRVAREEWRSRATISLSSDHVRFKAGTEYVAFLIYNESRQQFYFGSAWKVVGGRVHGFFPDDELGVRDGSPVGRVLTQMRETTNDIPAIGAMTTSRPRYLWRHCAIRPDGC